MRRASALIAVLLLALPSPAAAQTGGPADRLASAFAHLRAAGRALEDGDPARARDQVERAVDAVEAVDPPAGNASRLRDRVAALRNVTDPTRFRTGVHRAEVAAVRLAEASVRAAIDAGDLSRAQAWLQVARDRVDQPGRALPFDRVAGPLANGSAPSATDVAAAFDAVAAFRMLEEVQLADDLQANGSSGWRRHADRAGTWWKLVQPRAKARLPDAAYRVLADNVTDLQAKLAGRSKPKPLPAVRGPLTSLAYHRSIERLDEVGAGVEAGIFALHRTARWRPARLDAVIPAFLADYQRHRGFVGVATQGSIRPLDRAVLNLTAAARNRSPLDAATRDAARHLRDAALLRYGLVVEVEHLAVRRTRDHLGEVRVLRPPIVGLASYRLRIEWEPSVVAVRDVQPRAFRANVTTEIGSGVLSLGGEADAYTTGAVAAHLVLRGVGEPGAKSPLNVTEARFTTTAGEPARVFLVRDGQATVANIQTGQGGDTADGDGNGTGPTTPALGTILAGLAVAAAAFLRRP